MNWIRHELIEETKILFQYPDYLPQKDKENYLDFVSLTNIGKAWEFISKAPQTKTIFDTYDLKDLHKILTQDTNIPCGQYRTSDAYIEQLRMHAPSYNKSLQLLDNAFFHLNNQNVPILSRAFDIHYDLIAIQPFEDFNKRTARLFMDWFLIQNGYRPILFNKRTDKNDYMNAIRQRKNGDYKAYSCYMYSCLLRSQENLIKQIKKSTQR